MSVGDQLLSTSALVFNSSSDYGGVSVKKGEETIKFAVRGEKFDTVMAPSGPTPPSGSSPSSSRSASDDAHRARGDDRSEV